MGKIFVISFIWTFYASLASRSYGSKDCNSKCDLSEDEVSCYTANMKWYSQNVVSAFNQRVITAAHIGEWKKKRGKPIFDPTRVQALLNKIAEWSQGPLDNAAIKDFFNLVINRTTLYEEDALHHGDPPKFKCTFFYDCPHGYKTECKETCSIDDPDLNCWRDDINVYTKSLLVSLNQMAVLEARLNATRVAKGLDPIDEDDVARRVNEAQKQNPGPLPDSYVADVFRRLYHYTQRYSASSSTSAPRIPEFKCQVSPSCQSSAPSMQRSLSWLSLSMMWLPGFVRKLTRY